MPRAFLRCFTAAVVACGQQRTFIAGPRGHSVRVPNRLRMRFGVSARTVALCREVNIECE
jgi:hypothetical protein